MPEWRAAQHDFEKKGGLPCCLVQGFLYGMGFEFGFGGKTRKRRTGDRKEQVERFSSELTWHRI